MLGYNLLLVETPIEAMIAAEVGAYDFFYEASECCNCGMVVGPTDDEFFPAVVVCDQLEVSWVVCVECAFPVMSPHS